MSKAEEILDVAERMARDGGYNGFSFRDIASDVGVKAASVHYHFPSKEALAVALARRYGDRFFAALGEAAAPDALERFVAAFRQAVRTDGRMCLCGAFGAEVANLPAAVADEVRRFFERNLTWLEDAYRAHGLDAAAARIAAVRALATLEGGLILATSLNDPELFDAVAPSAIEACGGASGA